MKSHAPSLKSHARALNLGFARKGSRFVTTRPPRAGRPPGENTRDLPPDSVNSGHTSSQRPGVTSCHRTPRQGTMSARTALLNLARRAAKAPVRVSRRNMSGGSIEEEIGATPDPARLPPHRAGHGYFRANSHPSRVATAAVQHRPAEPGVPSTLVSRRAARRRGRDPTPSGRAGNRGGLDRPKRKRAPCPTARLTPFS